MSKKIGFTLIELLVVISIIGVLLSVAIVSYTNSQQKGRDNKRKSDLKGVQQALELYYQQNGKYPSSSAGVIGCNVTGDSSPHNWGLAFTCNSITYMNPLPKEPVFINTNPYFFNSPTTSTYILSAKIENTKDPDLLSITCTPQSSPAGYNYCVVNP